MGIRLSSTKISIDDFFQMAFAIMREEMLKCFAKLGEECTVKVRDRSAEDSWIDHTTNLRSSTGYSVYDQGLKVVESAFATLGNGAEGSEEGRKMVKELASQYARVYALVVVAAMNYAGYVEAIDTKDVLASTELWARSVIDRKLRLAVESAIRRINQIKL